MISENYRAILRETHEQYPNWGTTAHKHTENVNNLIASIEAKTILDYGCGKGILKHAIKDTITDEIMYIEYDPGIPGKDTRPAGQYDLVICLDVMEHIEPHQLQAVMEHLKLVIGKLGFFVISNRYAKGRLIDGQNAHLIVEGPSWWWNVFLAHFQRVAIAENAVRSETYLLVAADDYQGEIMAITPDTSKPRVKV